MNTDLELYYNERAKEYEKIYHKPERQNDLLNATQILQDIFANKEILEIACGTGYWTHKIAISAKNILATDINESVIELAKLKCYSPAPVIFQAVDFNALKSVNRYEGLFGGFIWSHIKLEELKRFFEKALSLVDVGGILAFMDNNFVEGQSTPVTETDELGNTYQIRNLQNNTFHKVLKNFPEEHFIRQVILNKVSDIRFIKLTYYWILICKKK